MKYYDKLGYLLIVFLLFIGTTFPIEAEGSELNFHVKPIFSENQVADSTTYFDLNLEPGAIEYFDIELSNNSESEMTILLTNHTAYTNVNGTVEYAKDAEIPDPTLRYLIEEVVAGPESVTLQAGETKKVSFKVTMPQEAFVGYLAGGIRIQEQKEEAGEAAEGLAIRNEFSYVIGIVLSNSREVVIDPELELLDVFANQVNYRNVFSATLQNFTPVFIDQLEVNATVRKANSDEVLYERQASGLQMAPNSHFDFPIPLEGERFRSGDYLLTLTAQSKEYEWAWEQEFTVEADDAQQLNRLDVQVDTTMNGWAIAAGGLGLILVCLLGYLFKQKRPKEGRG